MKKIIPAQNRKIYMLAREKGIDNDTLHAHLYNITKKESIKDLTIAEAVMVIDSLSGNEKGRITNRQFSYIMKLAKELKWVAENGKVDNDALRSFIKKQVDVPAEQWLTQKQASVVIDGMKAILKKDKERKAQ